MIDISESIEACANHYGEQADAMRTYLLEGQAAALALPNRGPLRFTQSGALAEEIRAAYSEYGFYVFENVLSDEELDDIKADLDTMRAQFPTGPESQVNAAGEPALGADAKALTLVWSKPL
ncbi:MAG: phytanoyl-CoA dioxygenase, partial [Luminiphilus sp.]